LPHSQNHVVYYHFIKNTTYYNVVRVQCSNIQNLSSNAYLQMKLSVYRRHFFQNYCFSRYEIVNLTGIVLEFICRPPAFCKSGLSLTQRAGARLFPRGQMKQIVEKHEFPGEPNWQLHL